MASPLYLDATEFELRFGRENLIAFFDDDNSYDRSTDTQSARMQAAIVSVLQTASRRTTAALAGNYKGTIPFPVDRIPEIAIELTYQYVLAILFIRNPDYFVALKINLKDILAMAESLAKDLREAVKRMVDAEAPEPANVGGDVTSIADDIDYPCPPKSIFIKGLGDF